VDRQGDQGGAGEVKLAAPFPWFGGKSRVAPEVWARFGNVPNYVEPFAGSLAVLLGRPHAAKTETVNDRDCYLANFWRAVSVDPQTVAHYCDWPVNEADTSARHQWLVDRDDFRERMQVDPEFYDAKIAGWWVWGLCGWIGSGWCDVTSQLPHVGDAGRGVHRKLPHVGDAGRGVHRKLPHVGNAGQGEYFAALCSRLRRVRVACGDWSRVMGDSVTWRHGTTGIFLDPPYDDGEIDYAAGGRGVAADVAEWCREHGGDERLRIALCGYDGDHNMPGWTVHRWKAHGGFSGQRSGDPNGNPHRERIWFSPHCLRPTDRLDFDAPELHVPAELGGAK